MSLWIWRCKKAPCAREMTPSALAVSFCVLTIIGASVCLTLSDICLARADVHVEQQVMRAQKLRITTKTLPSEASAALHLQPCSPLHGNELPDMLDPWWANTSATVRPPSGCTRTVDSNAHATPSSSVGTCSMHGPENAASHDAADSMLDIVSATG